MGDGFRALVLDQTDDGVTSSIKTLDDDALPEGDVVVDVRYSDLNYKDGMILNGIGKLVRSYPHVPGIDFSGVVVSSESPRFRAGDEVILTGWRVGEVHWGGYAGRARVKSDWLVPLPEGLTTRQAMAVGTAGLTAMLAVMALETHGLRPGDGPVLVTGAAGGVGSTATALLAALGHEVACVTGRPEQAAYLEGLGASRIVPRADLSELVKRPLESETWAGCIDAVAGTILARLLGQMKYGSAVAAVGLAGGAEVPARITPFILRAVSLIGIESTQVPTPRRVEAWQRIAREMPMDKLEDMIETATLADVPTLGRDILKGKVRGRVVGFAYNGEAVVVEHEAVPGYMQAMRMTLRPESRILLQDVEAGDVIAFRLVVPEHDASYIDEIEVLPPETELDLPPDVGADALAPDTTVVDTHTAAPESP